MSNNSTTTAYAANLVVSTVGVTVYGLSGYNSKGSAQFIQIHDASSLPADTAIPSFLMTVGASSNFSHSFGDKGMQFQSGCVVCNSSTGPTKTIGSADCFVNVQYI